MRTVHFLAASLALSVAVATPLSSQTPAGIPATGSRLRVSTRGERPTRFVGSVVRVTHDSVTLTDARGVPQAISLTQVDRMEMSRGKVGHPRSGGVIGFGIGLLGGGLIGASTFSDPGDAPFECAGSFLCDQPTRAGRTLKGAFLGGLIGVGVGALIGNEIKTDRWATISASSFKPTASLRPTLNGGAVASFALRF